MAVTKIRKISSWILWAVMAMSVTVFAFFYFGGQGDSVLSASGDALSNPKYTAELLYWGYNVFALAILALISFGILQFVTSLMTNPKAALASLSVIVVGAALLGITYAIGDPTPLPILNVDSAEYNVPFWLKVTDMWLYTMYILGVLCILSVLASSVMKVIKK